LPSQRHRHDSCGDANCYRQAAAQYGEGDNDAEDTVELHCPLSSGTPVNAAREIWRAVRT